MKMFAGFVLGAIAVAAFTTDRGKELTNNIVNGIESYTKQQFKRITEQNNNTDETTINNNKETKENDSKRSTRKS